MPIISKVESKTWKGRAVYAAIFTVLTIGGLTMIYPFLIMISGSLRSAVDEPDLDLIPSYLVREPMLYAKFLEAKYNQNVTLLEATRDKRYFSFRDAQQDIEQMQINQTWVNDMQEFWESGNVPDHWQAYGGTYALQTTSENLRDFRQRVIEHYDNDIDRFNREEGVAASGFNTIYFQPPSWLSQRYELPASAMADIYYDIMKEAPLAQKYLVNQTGDYRMLMTGSGGAQYSRDPKFRISQRVPSIDQEEYRRDWLLYVLEELNPSFVLTEGVKAFEYQFYLRGLYNEIDNLNKAWNSQFRSFEEIELPTGGWMRGAERADYLEFLRTVEPEKLYLIGPEFAWENWLAERYKDIDALNGTYGTSFESFSQVRLPLDQLEASFVRENSGSLRWQYATRNFLNVFDALFVRGRAFMNTVIFCTLSVVFALLVNPLAAYALSRFQLPGTYKILLLLMATMAFPPMVTMIPKFIILQKLDMMNTFAALLLPFIANGYLIFLLKGFFDSLPRELYEAATIDGASEVRIFFQVTMALSKPILAVVALSAFNSAYTLFLYALLVAPREDMWLISVWLYQFQQTSSMSGTFASVLIASVPTLLVFVFCQNIIMRGLVVPVEK